MAAWTAEKPARATRAAVLNEYILNDLIGCLGLEKEGVSSGWTSECKVLLE